MKQILDYNFLGNTVSQYLYALGLFLFIIVCTTIFKKIILSKLKTWAKKTETTLDDIIIRGIEKAVIPLIYFLGFYTGLKYLNLPASIDKSITIGFAAIVTIFIIKIITSAFRLSLNAYVLKQENGDLRQKQLKGITSLINFIIWVVGFLFLLDNLGFKVSTVITGLGIGGIAVALAAQTILGDLFSYFIIFFDRPFEIGDFINVADKSGNVEYIGIKSTRLRSLTGEQLVISNTDLVSSRIHNFKKMEKRRILFKLGVIYETPAELLKEIPSIVKKIIDEQRNATFDRGHFSDFGDFSLNFEFVYYVLSSDYAIYRDIQQEINFKIFEEFEKRGISFAYPTQTLFINKENDNN